MDLKALRDDAQHWSTGGQSHRAAERMAKCVLLLTNPDPLTLDAAKAVMGREPDETSACGTCVGWESEDISVWSTPIGGVRAHVLDQTHFDPTIGVFALLVAAARMGEQA